MTRTYDRQAKTYDFDVLTRLVEAGQGTFFEGPGIFVIKTENGTVAVRPEQVTFTPSPLRILSPMDGYHGQEQYDGEDTGPGGVVYDSALALAEKWIAVVGKDKNADPLVLVRRILDDEDREYELALQEDIDDTLRAQAAPKRRNGWVSADEADELLSHFTQ